MSRARTPGRPALSLAFACAACTPPAAEQLGTQGPPDDDDDTTTSTSSATGEPPTSTTGVYTTTAPDSTSSGEPDSTSSTGDVPAEPPAILDIALIPDPLLASGHIAVTVTAPGADVVSMRVDDGPSDPLTFAPPDQFTGAIAFFSSQDNGMHRAYFVPERDGVPGDEVMREFFVALPEGGSENFWEAVDLLGKGYVAAVATLPTGDVLEFGTLTDAPARCYLRRRTPAGAWTDSDVVHLSETPCTAIDLGVGEAGEIYLLADRTGVGDLSWWLARAATFGAPLENLRLGAKGETAHALAMHPNRLAVCGTQPTPQLDLDAAAWIVGIGGQTGVNKTFDYQAPKYESHDFSEIPSACAFAESTLVMVGEARGLFDPNLPTLSRRFLLEYTLQPESAKWTVDVDGLQSKQSGATALVIDGSGSYVTAGYSCGHPCEPKTAELRAFVPGGAQTWQMDLSPKIAPPTDLARSPAGFVVFASSVALAPMSSSFIVQAWKPGVYPALWSYEKNVAATLHEARSVAVGKNGQIYAGGVGANDYPAVAFVHP